MSKLKPMYVRARLDPVESNTWARLYYDLIEFIDCFLKLLDTILLCGN